MMRALTMFGLRAISVCCVYADPRSTSGPALSACAVCNASSPAPDVSRGRSPRPIFCEGGPHFGEASDKSDAGPRRKR